MIIMNCVCVTWRKGWVWLWATPMARVACLARVFLPCLWSLVSLCGVLVSVRSLCPTHFQGGSISFRCVKLGFEWAGSKSRPGYAVGPISSLNAYRTSVICAVRFISLIFCSLFLSHVCWLQYAIGWAHYADFLEQKLPLLLENVPVHMRKSVWFFHDGAPPLLARRLRNWFDKNFRDRWIEHWGSLAWPPRSPDLTPFYIFICRDAWRKNIVSRKFGIEMI